MKLKDILKEKVELTSYGFLANSIFEVQISHIHFIDELLELNHPKNIDELELKFIKFVKNAINEKIERGLK